MTRAEYERRIRAEMNDLKCSREEAAELVETEALLAETDRFFATTYRMTPQQFLQAYGGRK